MDQLDTIRLLPGLRHRARSRPRLRACLDCGKPTTGNRCPDHQARAEQQRGTTTERGYGHQHQQRRTELAPLAIGQLCPYCHRPMRPGQALDLDHSTTRALDPSSVGDRMAHATCNRRAGATTRRAA